jgi:2'-5' RNA ligase
MMEPSRPVVLEVGMAVRHRRLFVAIDPDEAVRAGTAAAIAALGQVAGPAARGLRFVDPATVHLTIRFLGNVPEPFLAQVTSAVASSAAAGRPLRLEVRGLGAFPIPGRTRVVWLGVAGDLAPLEALAATLDRRLAPLGFPAERAFRPHLTLARARRGGALDLAAALRTAAAGLAPVPWRATTLTLFESQLERGGARHLPLLRAPLGA